MRKRRCTQTHKSGEMKTIRKRLPTHKRAMTMWRICAHPIICHSITLGGMCAVYSISNNRIIARPYHWPISSEPMSPTSPHFVSTNFILFIRHIVFYDILISRGRFIAVVRAHLPRAHTWSYIYNYKKVYRFIFSHAHAHAYKASFDWTGIGLYFDLSTVLAAVLVR